MPQVKTKKAANLTLKDLLSRLTYPEAVRLIGEEGSARIQSGGRYQIDIDEQVYLGDDLFRLSLPDATVTITRTPSARRRLLHRCSACGNGCDHVGAAFSLILEEKMTLGLAEPPPERVPVESLGEEELVSLAIEERAERARTEKMRIQARDAERPWTDYAVANATSGKTYRVALRGFERGDSYCSCPDFRKNTLGTCKHILRVISRVQRKFSARKLSRPYQRRHFGLHMRYGEEVELRLLTPARVEGKAKTITRGLRDRPITDMRELLRCLRRLEAAGEEVVVYPDAEEYVQQRLFQDRVQSLVAEIRRNPAKHALRQGLLKVDLLPYQLDGIAFAVGAGRAILADDMGLGKTIQGVGVAELLAREAGIRRVLVVCPASVKSQWQSEIHRFSERDAQVVLGPASTRKAQYARDCFFTICNYEQVLRDILSIESVRWDLVILDEGQRIKNWEAKTSRVVKGLRSRFALVLSGTPLENRLEDLYSVVEFIDEHRLGPAFRFQNTHRVTDEKGKVLGYRNLKELRERLRPILLRRTRTEVMQQLPARTTEIIRLTPTLQQRDVHSGWMQTVTMIVRKKYLTEMDLLRLQKALLMCRMVANGTFLVDKQPPGYSSKLEKLEELLCQLREEEGRKILLFSEWTTMLGLIEKVLQRLRIPFVRLDGSVPQKKRTALVQQFASDPECKLFLTTNAGATGLNIQAANTVINVDLPWNPAILEQRISRAHRMGQKRPVQVFLLVTEATIEDNLLATLSAKHELALAALDYDSGVDAVQLESGMEELRRRLELLLGAKPEAPLDQMQRDRQAEEARRAGRRTKVAEASGQLLTSAFSFLNAMLPEGQETDESRQLEELLKRRLEESIERDEQGRPTLTVTLPDASALDQLSRSLAGLLSGNIGGPARN